MTRADPQKREAAPLPSKAATTPTNNTQFNCSGAQTQCRREASRRLAILDSGHADPWQYDEVPLTEHQREAWQRTVAHLTAAGFRAILPAAVLEGLR